MILGVGIDLVEVNRFLKLLENNKISGSLKKLLERTLTKSELEVFEHRFASNVERGVRFLATRYAAKEAFSKAMGCGIGAQFSFQDLSVLNQENGCPYMAYSERLTLWLEQKDAVAHVSMSDEKTYVTAIVTICKSKT